MSEVSAVLVVFVDPENPAHASIYKISESEVDRPKVVTFELIKDRVVKMFHQVEVSLFGFGVVKCAIGVEVLVVHFIFLSGVALRGLGW